jgi:glycosyltransferase involved in cell wall biosynthesis
VVFEQPRAADYRASAPAIAEYLKLLLNDPLLRQSMGAAGRRRVVAQYDYRAVARRFMDILKEGEA